MLVELTNKILKELRENKVETELSEVTYYPIDDAKKAVEKITGKKAEFTSYEDIRISQPSKLEKITLELNSGIVYIKLGDRDKWDHLDEGWWNLVKLKFPEKEYELLSDKIEETRYQNKIVIKTMKKYGFREVENQF